MPKMITIKKTVEFFFFPNLMWNVFSIVTYLNFYQGTEIKKGLSPIKIHLMHIGIIFPCYCARSPLCFLFLFLQKAEAINTFYTSYLERCCFTIVIGVKLLIRYEGEENSAHEIVLCLKVFVVCSIHHPLTISKRHIERVEKKRKNRNWRGNSRKKDYICTLKYLCLSLKTLLAWKTWIWLRVNLEQVKIQLYECRASKWITVAGLETTYYIQTP